MAADLDLTERDLCGIRALLKHQLRKQRTPTITMSTRPDPRFRHTIGLRVESRSTRRTIRIMTTVVQRQSLRNQFARVETR
jgi:hypothetical protein